MGVSIFILVLFEIKYIQLNLGTDLSVYICRSYSQYLLAQTTTFGHRNLDHSVEIMWFGPSLGDE